MQIPKFRIKDQKIVFESNDEGFHPTISDACENIGAFYLASELLGQSFMSSINGLMKEYFALSIEEKMKLNITKSEFHRGYLPIAHENAKQSTMLDMKEAFDIANHLPPYDDAYLLHGPNVYPQHPHHFKSTIEEYYYRLLRTSEMVFFEVCREIGINIDEAVRSISKPLAQLRLLHYPPSTDTLGIGAGEHTDYGFITLIHQDAVGGLIIKTRDNAVLPILPEDGYLICLTGEALERITNGSWPATPHKVQSPGERSRYSTAFFFDPNHDYVMRPQGRFEMLGGFPKHEPVKMGDYLADNFDMTFQYRKSSET